MKAYTEHALLLPDAAVEAVDPLTREPVIRIPMVVTMEGVMNRGYKPASEVANPLFWRFLDGVPHLDGHPEGQIAIVTDNRIIAGYVDRPRVADVKGRPIVISRANVYSARDTGRRVLHKIFDLGMHEVSLGYWANPLRRFGTYHDPALDEDVEYDEVQTDMVPDHVATVDLGACTPEMGCGLKSLKLNLAETLTWPSMTEGDGDPPANLPPFFEGEADGDTPREILKILQQKAMKEGPEAPQVPPELQDEGAVPPHTTAKAPLETPWSFNARDGDAILERGGFRAYKQAHAWFEGTGTPEKKGDYKLPHHKVVGGSVKVVWRGVVAAAVVLQGGRRPVRLPAGDVAAVKRHIAGHYKQFDKEPPFDAEGKAARDWIYEDEVQELVEAWKRGEADEAHQWFDLQVRHDQATLWDRLRAALRPAAKLKKGGPHDGPGESPKGDDEMCDKCEALEQERDAAKEKLEAAEEQLEELNEAEENREREALLIRLSKATGLKDKKLAKALLQTGILPEGEDAVADLEALRTTVTTAELLAPTAEAVGSLGDDGPTEPGDSLWTVGRPGLDYEFDKFGRPVDIVNKEG